MADQKRQVAMVLDLNKCLGCHTCAMACKTLWTRDEGMEYMWWNSVNTLPGSGTPRNWEEMGGGFPDDQAELGHMPSVNEFGEAWEFNKKEVFYEGKGKTDYIHPKGGVKEWGPNWDEDQGGGQFPDNYFFYLPRLCNHCTNPACVAACPRKAIEKRDEDGVVVINEDRCRGYRFCMQACPYKKIYFNHIKRVSQKCIFCFPRLEKGVAQACARQCPGRIRFTGFRDDRDGPIYKLVEKWKVALPLHPEYGTEPNVFYVPPRAPALYDKDGNIDDSKPRIPNEYLVSLFGPKVLDSLEILKAEKEKTHRGEKSELIDTLIAYKWSDMFGGFDQDPSVLSWT